jgi:ribosomal 30S subunit maturation factor RimM
MTVRDEPHGELGVVAGYYELPQGLVLEVRGAHWKADIPFNEAFVQSVDRHARVIAVTLPDGLLEATADSRHESRD